MPSVNGDVEIMPVGDVVLWMANRKLTATLAIKRRNVESRFTVRDGFCFQASSTDPREYLGQHLINFGYIDEEQLQRAFDTQNETHVPLGRVLVMVEAITLDQLQKVVTFKTRESLLEALCWEEGTWKVSDDVDEDRDLDCELPIDLREVWSEASARQQMWSEIRRVFPSDATRVEVLSDPNRVDSSFDRRLLQLMQTGKSVGEAALELRAMDFQTYARLYDLHTRQLVRPKVTTSTVEVSATRPPSVTSLLSPLKQQQAKTTSTSTSQQPKTQVLPARTPTPPPARAPTPQPMARRPTPAPAPPASTASFDEFDLDIETGAVESPPSPPVLPPGPPPRAPTPPPMMAPQKTQTPPPSPSPTRAPTPPPKAPTPMGSFFGAGSYMMVKPEKATEAPGVKIPPEAADPEQALRLALAGRDWNAALLISQRILEHDPLNSEAIAAYRVAEANLRRREKDSGEPDFNRVPEMAMPRDEVALAHLTSKERYVLSRVDGKRTLQQIAAVSPIQRQELIRIVEAFVSKGVLRL